MRIFIAILLLSSLCMAQGCNKKNEANDDQQAVVSPKVESTVPVVPAEKEQTEEIEHAEHVEVVTEKPKSEPATEPKPQLSKVDKILAKLNDSAKKIKTYVADIHHLSRQPLFDSQTLRTGIMYYQRTEGDSYLRMDFKTLKQDDEPTEKCIEQYYFDGIWLTRIDHQLKEVKKYQLVDPEKIDNKKGVDAFDLISEHFPIVGFTGTDKLKKDFVISLSDPNENTPVNWTQLRLKVKPESRFKDDWVHIDFWIDNKQYLPVKMVTLTTEEEIYELSFKNAKVNQAIDKLIFEVKVPEGFVLAEEKPLEKK